MARGDIQVKHGIIKGHDLKWSSEKYKIIRMNGNASLLDYPTRKKVLISHELLKGWRGGD